MVEGNSIIEKANTVAGVIWGAEKLEAVPILPEKTCAGTIPVRDKVAFQRHKFRFGFIGGGKNKVLMGAVRSAFLMNRARSESQGTLEGTDASKDPMTLLISVSFNGLLDRIRVESFEPGMALANAVVSEIFQTGS